MANGEENLKSLRVAFDPQSVLKFTHEIGFNKLSFLDVNIEVNDHTFETSVYVKETSSGVCFNFHSECLERYKAGVVFTLVNRAYKVLSDQQKFETVTEIETNFCKQ